MPIEHKLSIHGADLALWEWPGNDPAILFSHGTGLHARTWDQAIACLPGRHCYSLDHRAHGHSSRTPPYQWRTFGQDVAAVAASLRLNAVLGVGHSMGAYAATIAAAVHPDAFSGLLLLDPVIRPKEHYVGPWKGADFVRRRRNNWSSPQQMYDSFKDRLPFSRWDRQVLRDYCEYGLIPSNGAFELACPPAIEAEIYENGALPEADIYAEIATVQIPVHIVRAPKAADPSQIMLGSPAAPDLVSHFANATDRVLADCSHFIPMEAPARVAQMIRELIPG